MNYGSSQSRQAYNSASGEEQSIETANHQGQRSDAQDQRPVQQTASQDDEQPRRWTVETHQSQTLETPHQAPMTANDFSAFHAFRQSVEGFRNSKMPADKDARNVAQIMLKQQQQRTARVLNNGFTLYPSNQRQMRVLSENQPRPPLTAEEASTGKAAFGGGRGATQYVEM